MERVYQTLTQRTPLSLPLLINWVATACITLIAVLAALYAVDRAVIGGAKEDITREMLLITEREPNREAVPAIASIVSAMGRRQFVARSAPGGWLYAVGTADGQIVVGNATELPNIENGIWQELDGEALGLAPGPVLLHVRSIDSEYRLLVGRHLSARGALLSWFLPVIVTIALIFGAVGSFILQRQSRNYRRQIQSFNQVFSKIEGGQISARLSNDRLKGADSELLTLSSNVNEALDEVERLLRGLERYSQVAAHELNHSISRLRDQLRDQGNREAAAQTQNLIELVTHILELAKIETTPGFTMKKVELNEVLRSATQLYSDAFEEKAVTLEIKGNDSTALVLGSRPLLESAIINLLSNALKHSHANSNVNVEILCEDRRAGVLIRDFGPGVEDTDLQALAALGRDLGSNGNGFGLRHVEAVAIRHGAQLKLENVDPGLKVSLHFPRLEPRI